MTIDSDRPGSELEERTKRVRERARALGFDAIGIARADVPLAADFDHYRAFIASKKHGEMKWLGEPPDVRQRVDTDAILAGARSVVCLARRYQRSSAAESRDPELAQKIARYARGRDYHNGLRKKLRRLAVFIRELGPHAEARPLCDDAPVLERAWAARAGLGFVGKNGMLIVPGEGSFVLLGEVVTTLELAVDSPMPERCGSCTRCLDACPTGAFERPFVLDPRKCISYLTIEHRSAVDVSMRAGIGEHLFGCDDCQTVCPFNASSRVRPETATLAFEPHPRWADLSLVDLLDPEQWLFISGGTPVRRATADGLARNAAIVLANRGDQAALPALRKAVAEHPSAMVRETCAWALDVVTSLPRRKAQGDG